MRSESAPRSARNTQKLAVLLHRLWVTGEVYKPLGYREERIAA